MIILLPLSSLVFTVLLIRATLDHSPERLWYKLIACAHFVILGLGAFVYVDPTSRELGILIGLCLSFLGDLFLALRQKDKRCFILGILFFTLAQLAYLSIYSMASFDYPVFFIALSIQIMVLWFISQRGTLDLPSKFLPFLIAYDIVLIAVFACAFGLFRIDPNTVTLFRLISAFFFFLSDTILFMVYFIQPKKQARIVAYLLLYHIAQTLIALSLWY